MKIFKILSAVLFGAMVLVAAQASSQEAAVITLKSLDGSVVMVGELQGFEAGFYNIVIAGVGLMSISEDLVTCHSSAIDCAALVGQS